MHGIRDGVWPTMVTPFTPRNKVDYPCLELLIEWYISHEVDGLFAVCQSSEMFFLSLDERVELASRVVRQVAGRLQVIASGHISDAIDEQSVELLRMAETGVDALVIITNRFSDNGSDSAWQNACESLITGLPSHIPLGIYECPYPHRRDLTPELLSWCVTTDRFVFLKDTCSDQAIIEKKLAAIEGTGLKLFNANSATLLESLKNGASGYSGVMANFHPQLYRWLVENWMSSPAESEDLHSFLTVASLIERQNYPTNAKYYLNREGLPIRLDTRKPGGGSLTPSQKLEIEQLRNMSVKADRRMRSKSPRTGP